MDEIFILQSKKIDPMFGEHKDEWVNVGWTDNRSVAIKWREGSHRDERKQFQTLKKHV